MYQNTFKKFQDISIILLVTIAGYGVVMGDNGDQAAKVSSSDQNIADSSSGQPIQEAGSVIQPERLKKQLASKFVRRPARSAFDVLEKTRLSVDYEEMGFRDIVRDLREQLGVNIVVYWPEMRRAGYSMDDPISLHLENVVAAQVIASMLDYLSGGYGDKIGYQVDRNVVTIRLKENIEEIRQVKTYYVADLLQRPSRIDNSRLLGMNNMGSSGYSGGFGYGNQFSPGQSSWGSGMNRNMQGLNMSRPSGIRPGGGR